MPVSSRNALTRCASDAADAPPGEVGAAAVAAVGVAAPTTAAVLELRASAAAEPPPAPTTTPSPSGVDADAEAGLSCDSPASDEEHPAGSSDEALSYASVRSVRVIRFMVR